MKIIARLISLFVKLSWLVEIADIFYIAMYSPSPLIASLRFITLPTVLIATAIYLFWIYTDGVKKARRQSRTTDERRKRKIQEQWCKEYETFYKEMHERGDNY